MTDTRTLPAHDQHLHYQLDTSWGSMVLETRGPFVTAVRPPVSKGQESVGAQTAARLDAADVDDASRPVADLADRLTRYFAGEPVDLVVDEEQLAGWLDAAGVTGFHREVSLALARVPRGVTITYGELAAITGHPGAARAVGSACSRNPLPIIVPCHRVLHAGARHGDVGTYGAGTGSDYKRRLLELEGAAHVR